MAGYNQPPANTFVPNVGSIVQNAMQGPKCNAIWVESFDEMLEHPTSPAEQLYFYSKAEPTIYVRETDTNGKVKNPIKVLHYTVEERAFGPEANFVTKDEHKQLYDLVLQMNDKLEKLLN